MSIHIFYLAGGAFSGAPSAAPADKAVKRHQAFELF